MKELIIYILISLSLNTYNADLSNILHTDYEPVKEQLEVYKHENKNEDNHNQKSLRQSLGSLHWNEANNIFPRYSVAKIIDVETEKSFYVKRTFGTNHADVEPLTIEDTNVIKSIWGSVTNWDRRAVIVVIDDYKIAASMNGYAHAGLDRYPTLAVIDNRSGGFGRGQNLDMVKGNGVDGHFCIHFYGSTTHGSRQTNAAHQTQVRRAAEFLD